jgi:hypothetical protein
MARTSIWTLNAMGARKPISDNLSQEEKENLFRSYFIDSVLWPKFAIVWGDFEVHGEFDLGAGVRRT